MSSTKAAQSFQNRAMCFAIFRLVLFERRLRRFQGHPPVQGIEAHSMSFPGCSDCASRTFCLAYSRPVAVVRSFFKVKRILLHFTLKREGLPNLLALPQHTSIKVRSAPFG